jgi:hypothetical protein
VSEGILAAVLIVAIVVGAACFAIRHLNKTAGRIAVVIGALAALVAALHPVVKTLVEPVPAPSYQVVAPAPGPAANQVPPPGGTGLGGGVR